MTTKKAVTDNAPPSSKAIDVRNSWIEIPLDAPPLPRGKRPPPLPSLPSIQVEEDWLEPPSTKGTAKRPQPQLLPLPAKTPSFDPVRRS